MQNVQRRVGGGERQCLAIGEKGASAKGPLPATRKSRTIGSPKMIFPAVEACKRASVEERSLQRLVSDGFPDGGCCRTGR